MASTSTVFCLNPIFHDFFPYCLFMPLNLNENYYQNITNFLYMAVLFGLLYFSFIGKNNENTLV